MSLRPLHDAGSAASGNLGVAELHFGLADKPDDAPDEGCIAGDYETRDGGVEYWLLEGDAAPRLILQLCNDGYGAAGVGEDEVTVAQQPLRASPVWRLGLALGRNDDREPRRRCGWSTSAPVPFIP